MVDLNIVEIDGKDYFEIESIQGKKDLYYYYGNENDPEDFKIFKLEKENNEEYLADLSYAEIDEAFKLFNEKHCK